VGARRARLRSWRAKESCLTLISHIPSRSAAGSMKTYLISLGAGLLVGVVYSPLNVRSPAPPVVALVGLLGILVGEQVFRSASSCWLGHRSQPPTAMRNVRHICSVC
jgi:XapX domain-containing protein